MDAVLKLMHEPFPRYGPKSAAKAISEQLGKGEPEIVVTGAGFGYFCYNAEMTRDEFYDENEETGAFERGIKEIERRLRDWGAEFRAEISLRYGNITFLVGTDGGVVFSGDEAEVGSAFDINAIQAALWIPPQGDIHITWKCYPSNKAEQSILLFPGGYIPNDATIQSHFHENSLILVCHEFCAVVQVQGKRVNRSPKGKIHEQLLAEMKTKEVERVFCLAHTESPRWNERAVKNLHKMAEETNVDDADVYVNFGRYE